MLFHSTLNLLICNGVAIALVDPAPGKKSRQDPVGPGKGRATEPCPPPLSRSQIDDRNLHPVAYRQLRRIAKQNPPCPSPICRHRIEASSWRRRTKYTSCPPTVLYCNLLYGTLLRCHVRGGRLDSILSREGVAVPGVVVVMWRCQKQ